jgi:hypothetical protein
LIRFRQSRQLSAIEALANSFLGLLISWAFTFWALPVFGLHPSPMDAAWITACYFMLSLIRSYALRRLFSVL